MITVQDTPYKPCDGLTPPNPASSREPVVSRARKGLGGVWARDRGRTNKSVNAGEVQEILKQVRSPPFNQPVMHVQSVYGF